MTLRAATLFGAVLLATCPASAEPVHGRIELGEIFAAEDSHSLSALLGEENRNDVVGDVRVTWEPHWENWDFSLHYEVTADAGDTPALTARRDALGIFPPAPPSTWWNLTETFEDRSNLAAVQKIDRLSLGYTSAHFVVRVGRQALTWGAGLVFHPMDLFDPFAPNAIDTEYKPGTDMAYAQWLFDDGSDLQFVAALRPSVPGAWPSANASSFALRWRGAIGDFETTFMAARDHGDWVAAAGVNGALAGATWNAEIVPTFVRNGPTRISALANVSDAMTIGGRDATLFAEYYRNGFGLGGHYALADLSPDLVDRLLRGQVFDTGRDYLALGGTLQWTPLLSLDPTMIANLDDGSVYAIAQALYSLRENLNLAVGMQIPVGPARSEFGGIPLAGTAPPLLEQPATAYLQLRQYF